LLENGVEVNIRN